VQLKEKKDEEKNLIKKIIRPKLIIKLKSKKMTLKELQGMIKEELESYMNEEEVDVDVDTAAGDVDADGAESGDDSEDVLRKIYDMLKDKFEAEEGEDDMDKDMDGDMDEDMDEDMMGEVKHDDDKNEAADMEEASSMGFGDKGNKKTSGTNAGYKTVGTLSEGAKRFQKLANIIK
jgi:hypothetical protein